MPAARRVVASLLPLVLVLLAHTASAAEGEKSLGFGIDYATWNVKQDHKGTDEDSVTAQGAQLAGEYEYGWNDTIWLRASVSGGYFSVPKGAAWSTSATIGITYALDVLRYVPLLHAGVGAQFFGGDGVDTQVKPVVEIGLGLAVLEGRTFSWGLVASFDTYPSEAVFFTVGPRLTWRWGYF